MDPISAVGIALSVASLAGQLFTGCIQGIQFIITAKNVPEESKYYNLRLRMEQQRLFAWSETSGLLDLENQNSQKIRESNTFVIHRTTILDLLVQIECLFKEFENAQRKNKHLKVILDFVSDENFIDPAKDASSANVPLSESRRKFIMKAMKSLKKNATYNITEGARRLWWTAFDKEAFEMLLQRFSTLNDNMTNILDTRLQTEIHRTTQDTNRGVLQLHKDLSSLCQLVMALDIKIDARTNYTPSITHEYADDNSSGLKLLSQLAKFKAFNESINPTTESSTWDEATGEALSLGRPDDERVGLQIDKSSIKFALGEALIEASAIRCEATYFHDDIEEPVWIEWKEYDCSPNATSPSPLIVDRVQKLAALLHHEPKPEAFRVPHCLGYFDNLAPQPTLLSTDSEEDEPPEARIGLVFRKPASINTSPISLIQLFLNYPKPRITDRIKLAHALSNCLLYLHSVNWLHKGLRSHNVVFFPVTPKDDGRQIVIWDQVYLSGFDFARPARKDETTEVPGDGEEHNMYRHPSTQNIGFGPRESYRKSFDIYSFGVVLVELCFWKSITEIVTEISERPSKRAKNVQGILMSEDMLSKIGGEMGEVVEEVVRKCIVGGKELGIEDGEDEMGDERVASKLGMRFFENVVKKLGDVKV
ncbi:1ac33562-fc1a-4abf-af8e-5321cf982a6b [Sclerotinia trifoliorum]|uniref:1ac33562-fc1a-4abf-af8e-5321cf982a6b n=1 Tax=Sclerotinia trifoliorum TaxID=28548 RepID=A0A8H2W0K8_9HELO|nr:1ac33562-fc1a-4abf-af8e-5321cf982a6b [Sclerotinia trifoliorum]